MNDVPGHTTLFIDGTAGFARDIRLSPRSYPFEGFAEFGFGYYAASPNNGPLVAYPIDVYYDDIVLSTARIGCLDTTASRWRWCATRSQRSGSATVLRRLGSSGVDIARSST